MVSLAIIGIVAVGALEAFSAESRAARHARLVTPAVAIAAEQLAQLELLDSPVLAALPDSLRSGWMNDGAQSYDWRASVTRVSQEPDLLALHVEVRWDGGAYALTTHAFRPMPAGTR